MGVSLRCKNKCATIKCKNNKKQKEMTEEMEKEMWHGHGVGSSKGDKLQ